MQLTATTIVTMTSLELVEYINNQRKEGEAVLRHDNFMVKVPQVLGENNAPKFLGTQTYGNNNTRAIYIFPKREGIPQQDGIRDHLNALEIAAIVDLQRVNTSLLAVGMEYQERKERLNALFMRKHNKAICLEVLRLAS